MLVRIMKKTSLMKNCDVMSWKYISELRTDNLQDWAQLTFSCSKLRLETLEKDVKYIQS